MTVHTISNKAQDETITVHVDYSTIAPSIKNVDVNISRVSGVADPSPNMMKLGDPFVVGAVAYQKIHMGNIGSKYHIRFLATTPNGDRIGQTLLLEVTA